MNITCHDVHGAVIGCLSHTQHDYFNHSPLICQSKAAPTLGFHSSLPLIQMGAPGHACSYSCLFSPGHAHHAPLTASQLSITLKHARSQRHTNTHTLRHTLKHTQTFIHSGRSQIHTDIHTFRHTLKHSRGYKHSHTDSHRRAHAAPQHLNAHGNLPLAVFS